MSAAIMSHPAVLQVASVRRRAASMQAPLTMMDSEIHDIIRQLLLTPLDDALPAADDLQLAMTSAERSQMQREIAMLCFLAGARIFVRSGNLPFQDSQGAYVVAGETIGHRGIELLQQARELLMILDGKDAQLVKEAESLLSNRYNSASRNKVGHKSESLCIDC